MNAGLADAGVRVRFEPDGREIELASGERLLDAVDDHHERGLLPVACRAGNCGECSVRVLAGTEWLEPASGEERATLSQLGLGTDARLGCQIHARTPAAGAHDPRRVILQISRAPG